MTRFRREAEEHAARAERERIEHRANELNITVAELQAREAQATPESEPEVEDVPVQDPHVVESLIESDKAEKATRRSKRAH